VRVVGLPDLSSMAPEQRAETQPVFAHIRGTCKRVRGFNQFGLIELTFGILRGPHRGLHTVWIEPHVLLVQRRRSA